MLEQQSLKELRTIAGKKHPLPTHGTVFLPKEIPHAVFNTGDSPLVIYVSLVALSVVISAFVDNIPYITTMIPLVRHVAEGVGVNEVCRIVPSSSRTITPSPLRSSPPSDGKPSVPGPVSRPCCESLKPCQTDGASPL